MTDQEEILDALKIESPTALTPGEFASLVSPPASGGTVVTLIMPMEEKGAETRKNTIVFKNALTAACGQLSEDQQDHRPIGKVLERLRALDDPRADFWQNQLTGLAAVIHEDGNVTAYRLPFAPEAEAHVSDRPRLRALLPLCDPAHYYILALDLNELRLFDATRWSTTELPLKTTPTSLDEANKFDDSEKSLQHHTVAKAGTGGEGGDATFHGHGAAGDDNRRKAVTHFYEMVNRSLPDDLPDRTIPIALFSDPAEAGHFRATYHATPLHEAAIERNTADLNEDETRDLITSWVADRERELLDEALEKLGDASATGHAATGVEEIVKAATAGRIDTLFLRCGSRRWGTETRADGSVTVHGEREESDIDLIELAAVRTAETGGAIRVVPEGKPLPEDAEVAAILRY